MRLARALGITRIDTNVRLISVPAAVHIVNLACLVWAVVAIELTLVWNHVSGVYSLTSTGQLIPFVIGLVGLLRLIHGLTVERSDIHVTNIFMVSSECCVQIRGTARALKAVTI
jgi:hypothetical protein